MLSALRTLNQLFEAGIAITALSLFIRALTFNLRDRVARAFAVILACVMVIFAGEAVSGAVSQQTSLETWLRFQWIGTIFLPAAYFHFSDALLETTGRPSRGRRRLLVRLAYIASALFVLLLPGNLLLGPLVPDGQPVPHLTRTSLSWVFSGYYLVLMLLAGSTIWRSHQRTVLSASRRRMAYLLGGSLALAVGSYPFLLIGSDFAAGYGTIFLISAALGNFLVFYALVAMAYATAFFGVPWPDRVIKSRLFKWLMRGPVTVFIVLAIIPLVDDLAPLFSARGEVVLPILVVLSVLAMEHLITLAAPLWERWVFAGPGSEDVQVLQTLQERVVTGDDLRQFLEAVLASVCDRFQTRTAFVAALDHGEANMLMQVGDKDLLAKQELNGEMLKVAQGSNGNQDIFSWGQFWLTALYRSDDEQMVGILGVLRAGDGELPAEQREALLSFGERAAMALADRIQQAELLQSLEGLTPRVERIQRLRAASRYDQRGVLGDPELLREQADVAKWVKDALSHYWGGPKLTKSPLRGLRVFQRALDENEGNPANAMRSILKEAIDRNKPEGNPGLSTEWLLYNLLEMKFLQGHKVRDVARRLAVSEADLYRKQRVAIESVARSLVDMERSARELDAERMREDESTQFVGS